MSLQNQKVLDVSELLNDQALCQILSELEGNSYNEYNKALTVLGNIFLLSLERTLWLLQKKDVLEALMQAVKIDNEKLVF